MTMINSNKPYTQNFGKLPPINNWVLPRTALNLTRNNPTEAKHMITRDLLAKMLKSQPFKFMSGILSKFLK